MTRTKDAKKAWAVVKSLNGSARAQDGKTLVYEGREYVSDKAKTSAFIQEYATDSGRKSGRSSRRAVRELRSGVRRLLGSPRQELEQAFASEELATALNTVKAGKAGGPERLIVNSLSWWLEAKSLFSPWQAGFRKRRCTTDQCLRLSKFVSDGFQSTNKERTVVVVVVDPTQPTCCQQSPAPESCGSQQSLPPGGKEKLHFVGIRPEVQARKGGW